MIGGEGRGCGSYPLPVVKSQNFRRSLIRTLSLRRSCGNKSFIRTGGEVPGTLKVAWKGCGETGVTQTRYAHTYVRVYITYIIVYIYICVRTLAHTDVFFGWREWVCCIWFQFLELLFWCFRWDKPLRDPLCEGYIWYIYICLIYGSAGSEGTWIFWDAFKCV